MYQTVSAAGLQIWGDQTSRVTGETTRAATREKREHTDARRKKNIVMVVTKKGGIRKGIDKKRALYRGGR